MIIVSKSIFVQKKVWKVASVLQNGEKQNTDLICYKITYWFELLFEEHKEHEICKDLFYKNRLPSGSQSSPVAFPGMAPMLGGLHRDASCGGAAVLPWGPRSAQAFCCVQPSKCTYGPSDLKNGFGWMVSDMFQVAFCTMEFRIQEFRVCAELPGLAQDAFPTAFWHREGMTGIICLFGCFPVNVIFFF